MKSVIKEFIPPILIKLLKGDQSGNSRPIYKSYQNALKLSTTDAYEEHELIEVILKKTKRFATRLNSEIIPVWETAAYSIMSILNPILESKSNVVNVLDFGGACGAHFFHIRSLVPKSVKINWAVVETPTMVKYAKELETDELRFYGSILDAARGLGNVDLLHSSGTLQYVDDLQAYLNQILSCNAKYLLFNRLGLNKLDRDVITIHTSKLSWNGIGELPEGYKDRWIKYPVTFISERKFLKLVEEKYSLVAKFQDESGKFSIHGEEIVGYGLLCRQNVAPHQ